jgi:hypothetical protein
VLVDQRQDGRQGHAPQVGGDHHPHPGQPVSHRASDWGQQQHRGDLSDDRAGDPKAGAGQAEHQHDQGDGVEGVAPSRDGLGDEQAPVGGPGQDRAQPGSLGGGHDVIVPDAATRRWLDPRCQRSAEADV